MPYTMDDELPDYADLQISDMEKGIADRLREEREAVMVKRTARAWLGSYTELMALYREMDEAERYEW